MTATRAAHEESKRMTAPTAADLRDHALRDLGYFKYRREGEVFTTRKDRQNSQIVGAFWKDKFGRAVWVFDAEFLFIKERNVEALSLERDCIVISGIAEDAITIRDEVTVLEEAFA